MPPNIKTTSPGLELVKLARRGALLNKEGFREVGGEGDIASVLFLSLSLSELQLFLFYANRIQCLIRTRVGWIESSRHVSINTKIRGAFELQSKRKESSSQSLNKS